MRTCAYACACIHTRSNTHIHTHAHTHAHAYTQTHMHTHKHTITHTHTHTHTHKRTRTRTHAHDMHIYGKQSLFKSVMHMVERSVKRDLRQFMGLLQLDPESRKWCFLYELYVGQMRYTFVCMYICICHVYICVYKYILI